MRRRSAFGDAFGTIRRCTRSYRRVNGTVVVSTERGGVDIP